jgi:lipopolysaccharide export system protein LptC
MSISSTRLVRPPPPRRPGVPLIAPATDRMHRMPSQRDLARRRTLVNLTKWLLPVIALALLSTVALWPEFDHVAEQTRLSFSGASGTVQGARLTDARYRGVDQQGRPYTLTASVAQQAGPERVNLTSPKGDITLKDGTWLMLQAKQGVYSQHSDELDLSHEVTLYRDDGTTMTTASASVDMKNGAAAGADPVHARGPFGTLDAQGFTLLDKGTIIQFAGPAHLVLNGASP